jgi:hypothetical protein
MVRRTNASNLGANMLEMTQGVTKTAWATKSKPYIKAATSVRH